MTDLATLGLVIDSTQVKTGVGELDKLTAAGGRAEGAVDRLGDTASQTGAQVKSASAAAAHYAANVQQMARNVALTGNGMTQMGAATGLARHHVQNLAFQLNDLAVQLASGANPLMAIIQQGSQMTGVMSQAGLGVGGFTKQIALMLGILKAETPAALAAAVANAEAQTGAAVAAVARAKATAQLAREEIILAEADLAVATTTQAETAATDRLTAARIRLAAISGEAILAERALAAATAQTAAAQTAAAAATTTRFGVIAPLIAGVAIAGGLLVATFKNLQTQARESGHLEKYANSLGLTTKEMKELRQEVGGFTDDEMKDLENRVRAFDITWGDVFNGLSKTASDALDLSPAWQSFTQGARSAFEAVLKSAIPAAAAMYGYFVGAYRTIVERWGQFPNALGSAFVSAVNAAIEQINKLMKASVDGINSFIDQANQLPLVNIGHLATPQISKIKNDYGNAGQAAGKSFGQNVSDATADAQKQMAKNVATIWDNILGAAEDRIAREANAIIEDRTPQKGRKQSDHGLADALATLDAQINGQLRLAEAYRVSEAAAMKAEAMLKAEEQAIRHKGDVALFYEKQIALAVATRAADGGKAIAGLAAETAARKQANDAVSVGLMTAEQAQQFLQDEAQLRPLIVAHSIAEGRAKDELTKVIARLRGEQASANAEAARAQVLSSTASAKDRLEMLQRELDLINKTNAERAIALAQLAAEQYLTANPGASPQEAADYVAVQEGIARVTEELRTARSESQLFLDNLTLIAEQASVTADIMAGAFGKAGDVFGSLIANVASYQEARAALDADVKNKTKTQAEADKILANLQAKNTAQAISGFKSLFKEKSAGYKILTAIEMAYAALQVVNTIKSIALDTTKTSSSIANSAARASADGVAAVAKAIASLPFPLNLAAGAATAAALIAFGVKMFGGGGGGGSGGTPPPSAEELQEQAGTGTVLGDAAAKSASIANSLALVAENTNRDLEYSNAMLKALRNIDTSIAKMAGTVARQISVSGSLFDTSGQNLGTNSKKGFLGVFGGSTTTRTLYDLGVMFGAATVGSIIDQGITGKSYQVIEKIKKKKGFLGIGSSTKTTYETSYGALDPEITAAIQDVIGSLRDSLVAGADVIGLQGAEAILNSFSVNLGKISFKGMTGAEIEDQLNAIFSSIGDQMAQKLLPSLASMQLVGEGLFETFMRVAKEYQAVDTAMKSLGRTFGATGIQSVAMRDHLVQLFGGLEEFLDRTNFFRDEFLSEAEQIAPIASAVRDEMARLGMAGITTREQFKQAVLGLDLTSTAGREMYEALLAVAPAFDKVLDYVDKANKEQIDSLQKTIDQFTKFAESLKKYRDTLFETGTAQGNAYARLRSQFIATAGLAAEGDATALGGLESAGRSFLEAARNNASTREQYLRDVALVARGVDQGIFAAEETADYAQLQLDALENAVGILAQISTNTGVLADATKANIPVLPGVAPQPATATPATPPPTQEQTQTLIDQNAQIIALLRDQKQLWQRFEGDGLTVKTDSDTPLNVVSA